ncbi:MAG: TonB family protein, partial [Bacteroidetes bacterium]
DFWQKIYKGMSSDMCGVEPTLTGWITKFFPYIYIYNPPMNEDEDYKIELVKNLTMILPVEEMFAQRRGIQIPQLPPNRVSFPFKITMPSKTYAMQFNAGFIGVTQASDLTLKPQISWAVIEKNVTVLEQHEDGETITENQNQEAETFTEKDFWEEPLGYGSFENDSLLDEILLEILSRERGKPENFDKYIKKNLKYPKKALEKKISGEVILWINLEKDGTLSKVRLAEGLGYGLDEEAIRLVKNYSFKQFNQGERAILQLLRVDFKLPRKRK